MPLVTAAFPSGLELCADNLSCQRGRRVLFTQQGFALTGGQALQLSGANGSGKTSLLRMLAGLRSINTGSVHWCGVDVHSQGPAYRAALAYLAHEPALKLELSLRENLLFATRLAGQTDVNVDAALQRAGLQNRKSILAGRLSAGQRQRAALARLLAGRQPLWLLDEPCAHVDVAGRALVEAILSEHLQRGGLLVYTSHIPLDLGVVLQQRLELG